MGRKAGRIAVFVMALATVAFVANCDSGNVRPIGFIWRFDVSRDECGIQEEIKTYHESGERFNIPSPGLAIFAQDRDAFLRAKHRASDFHVLKYITASDEFRYRSGCQTKVTAYRKSAVSGLNSGKLDYDFRAIGRNLLCRIQPFTSSVRPLPPREPYTESGYIKSCINVSWRRTSFEVVRNNLNKPVDINK